MDMANEARCSKHCISQRYCRQQADVEVRHLYRDEAVLVTCELLALPVGNREVV
jgi:hypothetical protein